MRWGIFVLLFVVLAHLLVLVGIVGAFGPALEAEQAYAEARSCACSGETTEWCPAETSGTASCRWPVRTRVVRTPVTGGQKGNYTYWVTLEIYRGLRDGEQSRAELTRLNVVVSEELQRAVKRGTEVHAELWRDRVTGLRVDGVVFKTSALESTNSLVVFGAYALLVVLAAGAWLLYLASRHLSAARAHFRH